MPILLLLFKEFLFSQEFIFHCYFFMFFFWNSYFTPFPILFFGIPIFFWNSYLLLFLFLFRNSYFTPYPVIFSGIPTFPIFVFQEFLLLLFFFQELLFYSYFTPIFQYFLFYSYFFMHS